MQNQSLKTVEKFTIDITDKGIDITGQKGLSLAFSAVEALMLLDILRHEEGNLRKMADEASPLPMRFHFENDRAVRDQG